MANIVEIVDLATTSEASIAHDIEQDYCQPSEITLWQNVKYRRYRVTVELIEEGETR